jgi:hypothetical protein
MCPLLEPWHTYKQASMLVFKNSSLCSTIWAPLQHYLAPNDRIYQGAKLAKVCVLLTAVRVAWPMVEDDVMKNILEAVHRHGDGFPGRYHIENFVMVVTKIIPVVSL